MIDAACKAIKQATGIEAKLTDFVTAQRSPAGSTHSATSSSRSTPTVPRLGPWALHRRGRSGGPGLPRSREAVSSRATARIAAPTAIATRDTLYPGGAAQAVTRSPREPARLVGVDVFGVLGGDADVV